MAYKLSKKAEEDVIAIFHNGRDEYGERQAVLYHQKLAACFDFLAENPFASAESLEINPPVRIHPVGRHIVVYMIEDNRDVFIVRVRHQRENWLDDPSVADF